MSSPPAARVALFHPAFETIGGAEILVATQARYLKQAGLDVHVVTLAFDPVRWKSWFEGIPIIASSPPPWPERFLPQISRLRRALPRADAVLSNFRTVLACNYPCNSLLGASSTPARRLWCSTEPARGLHLVATNPRVHDRVVSAPGGIARAERVYARKLLLHELTMRSPARRSLLAFDVENTRRLDAIYAISEFARDNVRRAYGRTDAEVIYPMVRFPSSSGRRRAGIDRAGLRILVHTRLTTPKNVDSVLRGFGAFFAKRPGARLHVVGEGGERPRLGRLARRLGILHATTFHGYLPDKELEAVYDACDVFALLPLDEPFGMVFPEAAARGLLLVGPDHGGPFEILDGGRLGWTCDPFSPEALAAAFEEIWASSDGDLDARRSRAEKACRDRYSEATIGPQLRHALEE